MTRSQKVLLGVLLVIIVLYVAAVGTGGHNGIGNTGSGRGGLVGLLHRWMPGGTAVARADLSSPDCPLNAAGQATVHGHCVLTVAGRKGPTRQLRVTAGQPLTITAPVSGRTDSARTVLAAGDEATVVIDAGGAVIAVDCDAATCTVTVAGMR